MERSGGPLAKQIGDPVRGVIELSPIGQQFIQGQGFQRLRRLKQLGITGFITRFSSGIHTRFQHSLGVGCAARSIGLALWEQQPHLDIRPEDIDVLELAGLGHDTGHGPFSHLFEYTLLPALGLSHAWRHEEMSMEVIDHIVDEVGLDIDSQQRQRIRDVIRGKQTAAGNWGLGQEYLTQVVSCEGLDVDRWDYFRRDSLMTGVPVRHDYNDLFGSAKGLWGPDGRRNLCFKYSYKPQAQAFVHDRYNLFDKIYTSAAVRAGELMVVDIMKEANHVVRVQDRLGRVEDFLTLDDDSLLYSIMYNPNTQDSGIRAAQGLIQWLWSGDLYPCCGEVVLEQQEELPQFLKARRVGVEDVVGHQRHSSRVRFKEEDIYVDDMVHKMSKEGKNPLYSIPLYDEALQPYYPPQASWELLPDKRKLRVILRKKAATQAEQQQLVDAVHAAFCSTIADYFGPAVQVEPHDASPAAAAAAVAAVRAVPAAMAERPLPAEQQQQYGGGPEMLQTPLRGSRRGQDDYGNAPASPIATAASGGNSSAYEATELCTCSQLQTPPQRKRRRMEACTPIAAAGAGAAGSAGEEVEEDGGEHDSLQPGKAWDLRATGMPAWFGEIGGAKLAASMSVAAITAAGAGGGGEGGRGSVGRQGGAAAHSVSAAAAAGVAVENQLEGDKVQEQCGPGLEGMVAVGKAAAGKTGGVGKWTSRGQQTLPSEAAAAGAGSSEVAAAYPIRLTNAVEIGPSLATITAAVAAVAAATGPAQGGAKLCGQRVIDSYYGAQEGPNGGVAKIGSLDEARAEVMSLLDEGEGKSEGEGPSLGERQSEVEGISEAEGDGPADFQHLEFVRSQKE